MNVSTTHKCRRISRFFSAALLSTAVMSAPVFAGGFFGHHGHQPGDMLMPIERMVDHVDLTSTQQNQVDAILDEARSKMKDEGPARGKFFKQVVMSNPDDPDYQANVEQQAEKIATHVKERFIAIAKVRKQVFDILTEEQKQELQQHIEKRMAHMEKRMARHHGPGMGQE